MRVVKKYENSVSKFKEKFDVITNKIKNQDLALIETGRNSIRTSTLNSK